LNVPFSRFFQGLSARLDISPLWLCTLYALILPQAFTALLSTTVQSISMADHLPDARASQDENESHHPSHTNTYILPNTTTLVSMAPTSKYNVRISQRINLDILHVYSPGTYIEYPESSKDGHIGHLFTLDPEEWYDLSTSFAYSTGEPKGRSKRGKEVFCEVLVDENGDKVPCRVTHSTCMYYLIR
jgi:hypothetical protein